MSEPKPLAERTLAEQNASFGDSVIDWFSGLSSDHIKVLEHGGEFMIEHMLARRHPTTKVLTEEKCLLRVPRLGDQVHAIAQAFGLIADKTKSLRPKDIDEARRMIGDILWEQISTCCIVAQCLRNPADPSTPLYTPKALDATYPPATLYATWDKINLLSQLVDPRIGDVTDAKFWILVEAIWKVGNLGPLAVIAGGEQDSFVLRTVRTLIELRTQLASLQSPASSPPDSSQSKS